MTTSALSTPLRVLAVGRIVLGAGYRTSAPDERHRRQRLALGVDISDTVTGVGHLWRRDLPSRAAIGMVALTGTYAAVGAARLARDLRE
jgi:hypothetical protein